MLEILLIEDNPGDVRLTQEAFRENHLNVHLNIVADGIEAMVWLRKEGRYSHVVHPDIILLDLNLPRKNGLEVLQEIKSDKELKKIPTLVLTSSDRDVDVLIAYKHQANAYLVKPATLSDFGEVIDAIVALSQ